MLGSRNGLNGLYWVFPWKSFCAPNANQTHRVWTGLQSPAFSLVPDVFPPPAAGLQRWWSPETSSHMVCSRAKGTGPLDTLVTDSKEEANDLRYCPSTDTELASWQRRRDKEQDRCPPKRPVIFADFPFLPYTSISSSSHLLFRRIDWPQDGWVHGVHLFMPHIYVVYIIWFLYNAIRPKSCKLHSVYKYIFSEEFSCSWKVSNINHDCKNISTT